MGDPRGFLKLGRVKEDERPLGERIHDWRELVLPADDEALRAQASRCMDCGIPFCHQGCPLANLIPDWNELTYAHRDAEAIERLHLTNNFPEVTGRVCPAPCEASCVLNLDGAPVTIKAIERSIADAAFAAGPLEPVLARSRSGARVGIIGSGPAGLAAAQQLARAGHDVTVFERDDRLGGLLRYGIPDFKMEKGILDRRLDQLRAEGVTFTTGVEVGVDIEAHEFRRRFDAALFAVGARAPRDLPIPGRETRGVELAMDFLTQQNRRVSGDELQGARVLTAEGKRVVVIGGGDTGSDCVGTSIRQGARSVTQVELMPKPALVRMPENPWPEWPLLLRTSSSQEEGAERDWAVSTRGLRSEEGHVCALEAVRVAFEGGKMREIPGSAFEIPCELVLLAMGFVSPERGRFMEELGLDLDARGNVLTSATGATNVEGVFAAGDASRGQSLVVWAIADGRRVAAGIDAYLRMYSVRHTPAASHSAP